MESFHLSLPFEVTVEQRPELAFKVIQPPYILDETARVQCGPVSSRSEPDRQEERTQSHRALTLLATRTSQQLYYTTVLSQ